MAFGERTPVMVSTASKVFTPVSGMPDDSGLISGLLLLAKGLDLILMGDQNFN
jgi:hypothetical protein